MNWLDIVLLFLILGSVVASISKGLTREVVSLLSVLAAIVLGIWFYGTAGSFLLPYLNSKGVANFCGFLLVFCGVLLIGSIVGYLLSKFLTVTGLSFFDRLLGAAFGAVRGVLLSIALVMAILAFAPGATAGSPPRAIVGSRLAPYMVDSARMFASMAPYELKTDFRKSYDQVKIIWRNAIRKGIRELPSTPKVAHERNI